uniref:Methyl-CpG-binding domain protein 2-like n=1 Tax=Sinocyclocheilus grahami TaxID=75366 RepID=A0A672JZ99_SINGR
MERKKTDCPALPPGWKKEEVIRKSGLSAGKSDVYYYSPTGKKFRSKPQLSRYLGNSVDLGCFDFRTGKMMPSKMQKNKQRLRSDNLSLSKGKPDLNTALPIRQTASIFKQPVTKVVNHPNNKVKTDLQRATEQPRQVHTHTQSHTHSGLNAFAITLLSAIASALHMSSAPITGQTSSAADKNPSIWLNTSQPLCKAFTVTDDDIRDIYTVYIYISPGENLIFIWLFIYLK